MWGFSDEHQLVRTMIRRWVEAKLVPANEALESGEVLPYELMRDFARSFGLGEMVRAGLERALARGDGARGDGARGGGAGGDGGEAAEEPDGDGAPATATGGDPALQAIVAIELSRVNPGFYLAFGASLGLAGGAVLARGTPTQQRRFALPLLTLEKIGCWGMTEPGAGSDAFRGMRTVARPDGDGYVLNGQKTFITNAPHADVAVVYAKIDRGEGTPMAERPIHAFLVERGTPGFSQPGPMRKMGMHSSPTGELFLEDVRVPRDRLLGEAEASPGRAGARDVFHGERTSTAPMALGIIDACLEKSVAYARERVTWGRPIAEYQLVQEKLARMYVHRQNVEALLFKGLALARARRSLSAAEASATKLYCARAATEVALEAVQLLGGNGYMREYHVEQLARDAKLLQIGGGTDEIQIINIARSLV